MCHAVNVAHSVVKVLYLEKMDTKVKTSLKNALDNGHLENYPKKKKKDGDFRV